MVQIKRMELMFKLQDGTSQDVLKAQEAIEMYGLFTVIDAAWIAAAQSSLTCSQVRHVAIVAGLAVLTLIEAPVRTVTTLYAMVRDVCGMYCKYVDAHPEFLL